MRFWPRVKLKLARSGWPRSAGLQSSLTLFAAWRSTNNEDPCVGRPLQVGRFVFPFNCEANHQKQPSSPPLALHFSRRWQMRSVGTRTTEPNLSRQTKTQINLPQPHSNQPVRGTPEFCFLRTCSWGLAYYKRPQWLLWRLLKNMGDHDAQASSQNDGPTSSSHSFLLFPQACTTWVLLQMPEIKRKLLHSLPEKSFWSN